MAEMVNPKNPGNRKKAYSLRAKQNKGQELRPEEIAWLDDYDRAQRMGASHGASASERVVHIEERAAAVGTGTAAETAAAAALAREEGRRVDYLVHAGMDCLVKACQLHETMTRTMLERLAQLEDVHLAMLGSVREHYIARTEAEAEQIKQGGQQEALVGALLERLLQPAKPANGRS